MTVSYLEIYNEKLRDLLDPSDKILKIYAAGGTVLVKNLSTVYCSSYDDILKV